MDPRWWSASIAKHPDPLHRLATLAKSTSTPTSFGEALVVPGGRPEGVVEFDRQVVDFFVSAADLLGVPKSVAAIYGIVFASPMPVSFAEVSARLDISKGSISQGLRVLREVGAIREVSAETDRTELFTPDLGLRKVVAHFLENRLEKHLVSGSSRLDALKTAAPDLTPAENAELARRLKAISDWHKKARSVLPLVRSVLKMA